MKRGKAADMDGIVVEMLKNGGISITDWLLRIFNKCTWTGRYTKGKMAREIVLIIEE